MMNPDILIFKILNDNEENYHLWEIEPIGKKILLEGEGFYLIKAMNIININKVTECFMDISMIERINDYVYFFDEEKIYRKYTHECEGDVIPAVPIASFGNYELFYSKIIPNIGLNVLRNGFLEKNNVNIAEDLAYILRDEGHNEEAINYFQYSVNNTPSSCYIYHELAQLYKLENEIDKYEYYNSLFNESNKNIKKGLFENIENRVIKVIKK